MEESKCTYSALSDIVSVYQYSQILLVTKSKTKIVIQILRYHVAGILRLICGNISVP